ncbi:MAG: hypothetical protein PHX18_04765 [Candidatus Gastranaerophilales bacterium]|nr:hypothetical protein [Candidatus Gastranaerophilales bacterium]
MSFPTTRIIQDSGFLEGCRVRQSRTQPVRAIAELNGNFFVRKML